ncbi:C39 family peptidase [Lyngbya sp. PCC 8106]|uniref:C39 family peptidase n=1 Tax=Lyngbya sp. (strain PCC 8106) TaxID=313612 RepID=UPI0000EA9052|nr:C39 family peptidase [Lyngbya sp. PCC 8106]EAW35265.1 prophage LambdaCh01, N-acetylmuramoyl-L-alanine amidase [Lyngbya sp. PCC 8106]
MQYILHFKTDSYLKRFPFTPEKLLPEHLLVYKAGDEIPISGYTLNLQGNHIRVILEDVDVRSVALEDIDKQYYCLASEVEIFNAEVARGSRDAQKFPPTLLPKVNLAVPFHTQHNNKYNPGGSCNVTCIAMILKYYGIDSRTKTDLDQDVQLEDVLYLKTSQWDKENGFFGSEQARHKPLFLMRLLREWGQKYGQGALQNSHFKEFASENEIKQHIASGNPVVIHGYFTHSGHIIVVKGYDETTNEWICNDPNGKWLGYQGGYDKNASGENVRYSYDNINEVCHIGGGIWCHFPVPRVLRLKQKFIEGSDVIQVQTALKKLGYLVDQNGVFDKKTDDAIKQFQQEKNLTVDGVVGPATWAKLLVSFA